MKFGHRSGRSVPKKSYIGTVSTKTHSGDREEIVVKFGVFLVITRDHGRFWGRHQVEALPTDLPELFKPARDLLEPRKLKILGPKFSS